MSLEKQDNLHKELDLIQSVISRMAHNSFLIRGWAMTLLSALFAFGKDSILTKPDGAYYLAVIVLILIPFWWLDSFYLFQERIYRKIYRKVIHDPEAKDRVRYDLSPAQLNDHTDSVRSIMWLDQMKWFYLSFILLLLAGIIAKMCKLL
ncbi:MAG: hypothetical protein P4L51_17025 [Puia sp.]|nr:hypothetical protein [Puia sp.]